MQYLRVSACGVLTVGLLIFDAVMIVAGAGEEGLGGSAFLGRGIGAMATVLVALALADAVARQWGSEGGVSRAAVLYVSLGGLFWELFRVELGDVWAVPAIVGLTWMVTQVSLFSESTLDDEETETDEAAPHIPEEPEVVETVSEAS